MDLRRITCRLSQSSSYLQLSQQLGGFFTSLLRRLAVPFHRLLQILLYAITIFTTPTQIALCNSISLLRSLAKPFYGLYHVLLHTFSISVAYAKVLLRVRIPGSCLLKK